MPHRYEDEMVQYADEYEEYELEPEFEMDPAEEEEFSDQASQASLEAVLEEPIEMLPEWQIRAELQLDEDARREREDEEEPLDLDAIVRQLSEAYEQRQAEEEARRKMYKEISHTKVDESTDYEKVRLAQRLDELERMKRGEENRNVQRSHRYKDDFTLPYRATPVVEEPIAMKPVSIDSRPPVVLPSGPRASRTTIADLIKPVKPKPAPKPIVSTKPAPAPASGPATRSIKPAPPPQEAGWQTVHKKKPSGPRPRPNFEATLFCANVLKRVKCSHGANCRFAHHPEELKPLPCSYGERCCHIRRQDASNYSHIGNKVCRYWHPNENVMSFLRRQALSQ